MKRLNNKTCVITGAAQGIGLAIANSFAQEGARVILTDKNYKQAKVEAERLEAQSFELDVKNEHHWDLLHKIYPEIDVLVNNAGITGFEDNPAPQDPEHASLENWREVHRVNLYGTFLGCRYAIKAMRPRGEGSIINISSRSGMVGIPAAAAYASSKAAIRNHSKTVALYCAEQGLNIRCNSIHPAAILTPMWEPMLGDSEGRKKRMEAIVADTPARRFGEANEVASLAVLLASDEAAYMTGTELTIDGGLLAGSVATPSRN